MSVTAPDHLTASETSERSLAKWIVESDYSSVPKDVIELMKTLTFVISGTVVAGSTATGSAETVELAREWGGREEATILVHGGKVPTHAAVLPNSVMARAHDICDFLFPGQHLGTSIIPVAYAVAEKVGGSTGEDFLAALAIGAEVGARFGRVSGYLDGFDPSGIGTVFSVAAVAGKLMGLDAEQMHHALALAFNRVAGSFQSNIDASHAVRLIQAFSSQNGVVCAELAQRGLTGPENYVEGTWGFWHLFAKGNADRDGLIGELGARWDVRMMGFKRFPACGATAAPTDAIYNLVTKHGVVAEDVESVHVRMASKLSFTLVGHDLKIGPTPNVSGQFSVQYTIANVLERGFPTLEHFADEAVTDPKLLELAQRVYVELVEEPAHQGRASVEVKLRDGTTLFEQVDVITGGAFAPLTKDQLVADFWSRSSFGGVDLGTEQLQRFLDEVERLEDLDDVRVLVELLVKSELASAA